MIDIIDLGIIRFEPSPNISDQERLTAAVDAIETYVSADLGNDGLWIISIDGEFVSDEYPDANSACMAALGHLVIHAVDVVVQAPGTDDADLQRQAKLCRDWLNTLAEYLHAKPYGTALPRSVEEALNSGDGAYRP